MGFRDDGPAAGEERYYTPHALGNRDLPDPTRVVLRNPTEAQRRRFYLEQRAGTKVSQDGPIKKPDGSLWIEMDVRGSDEWRRLAIEQCLVRVDGYERRATSGWVGVITATDFYTHARREFVDEVSEEIITGYSLTEDERGKSEGSFDTTPRATQARSGTAESVASNGSVSHADAIPLPQTHPSLSPEQRGS